MDINTIRKMPAHRQLQLMQEIAAGEAFNDLTFALVRDLERILSALKRDAIDQAAAENDALHGKEVSMLEPAWVSPCGMGVGY
jgi:hypothetical protein